MTKRAKEKRKEKKRLVTYDGSTPAGRAKWHRERERAHRKSAREHLRAGRYAEAIQAITKAIASRTAMKIVEHENERRR